MRLFFLIQLQIEAGELGSPPGEQLLHTLKPAYWFAAHLHTKFAAMVSVWPPTPSLRWGRLSPLQAHCIEHIGFVTWNVLTHVRASNTGTTFASCPPPCYSFNCNPSQ